MSFIESICQALEQSSNVDLNQRQSAESYIKEVSFKNS